MTCLSPYLIYHIADEEYSSPQYLWWIGSRIPRTRPSCVLVQCWLRTVSCVLKPNSHQKLSINLAQLTELSIQENSWLSHCHLVNPHLKLCEEKILQENEVVFRL